jgi:endothelin-converting enzyme/putative endopeptidase
MLSARSLRLAPFAAAGLVFGALAGCEEPPPVVPTTPLPTAAPSAATPPVAAGSALTSVDETALDKSVAACTDFYQFACGSWSKATAIPADKPAWTRSFDVIQERNENELRAILERYGAGQGKDEPNAQKLGDFYAACVDEGAIEKAGLGALKGDFDAIASIKTAKDLIPVLVSLHGRGVPAAFAFESQQDFKDATQVIAAVSQAGLGMPDRDYYLKNDDATVKIRADYVAHVTRMFELLGETTAAAQAEAATVLRFEHALAQASMPREDRRDPQKIYHRLERDGLAKAAPDFAWSDYFARLGLADVKAINVAQPDFIKAFDALLLAGAPCVADAPAEGADKAATAPAAKGKPGAATAIAKGKAVAVKGCAPQLKKFPAAEWKTYLRWHTIRAAASSLSTRFVDERFKFEHALTGAEKLPPRWKRCVRATDDALGEALARPFVAKMLGAEGKAATKQMVENLERALSEDIEHLGWMDAETRNKAHEKLSAIANKIGYPDAWRSYDALAVDRGDYLANRLHAAAFDVKRDLGKIGKPLDRTEWEITPPTVNAYYEPSMNEIVFPAGILASPFYSTGATRAANYGGIGMVVGHELTHGFDDEGRQFDAKGNLIDWWSKTVGAEFDRRASCVEKQFDGYVAVGDTHLKGKLTLGENIADLGGLRIAFAAMKKELAQKPEPAASFTPEQQFFLGFAQAWCTNQRPEYALLQAKNNSHSPPRFRVNGPLSNMAEFAGAFQCAPDAPMVRKDRCEIW